MYSDALFTGFNLLLPKVLVSHFDLTKHEIKGEKIHLYFTETNNAPKSLQRSNFILKAHTKPNNY